MSRKVKFVVGNTYRRIPDDEATCARNRRNKKVHDWTLYVDVIGGDVDMVQNVSFDLGPTYKPSVFYCYSPVPVERYDVHRAKNPSNRRLRFSTRQASYGNRPVTVTIKIRGSGGSTQSVRHQIKLGAAANAHNNNASVHEFIEQNPIPLRMNKLPDTLTFGVELEMATAAEVDRGQIADRINREVGGEGRWRIVSDSSVACSDNFPACNTFELVSPVLRGGEGLQSIKQVSSGLERFSENGQINLNRSMGFHVHVGVDTLSFPQLVKVCQNFIKYESAMDLFIPPSRRTGSPEAIRYFNSNRQAVGGSTNKERHIKLGACADIGTLADFMNRDGSRYFKLNLQNLVSRRQPTIEFRQHSSTTNYQKISAWVRFCVLFVYNSARLAAPTALKENRTPEEAFEMLFLYVIKDRALRDFFQARMQELNPHKSHTSCGKGCGCSECTPVITNTKSALGFR